MNNSKTAEIVMPKNRLEALSDGVFAIVLTLLILEIKVPESINLSNPEMLNELFLKLPLFGTYFLSFALITNFWVAHHYMYIYRAKNVDRVIMLINNLYLCVLSLIPFSSHFLGVHINSPIAAIFYGLNITLLSAIFLWMSEYAIKSEHIDTEVVNLRTRRQGQARQYITFGFNALGVIFAFVNIPFALFLYLFPVIFNILPGSLNFLEKLFGFKL